MTTKEYLEQHSLNPDFVKTLGWQLEEESIIIPYYDENAQLLFYKERLLNDPEKKFKYQLGNSPALYASYKIKNQQVVVLCEGEPDCARLWQEGIPAVTGGGVTALNAEIALPLKDKDVIVLLDNDRAGQEAIKKTCEILHLVDAFPRVASLPKEYKDVCEFFTAGNSKQDFEQIINESVDVDVWEEQNIPEEYKIESGVEILKKELPEQTWLIERILPVDGITFIVGAEGTGKSFYTLTMAHSVATGTKWLQTFEVKLKTNVLFIDKENVIRRIQSRLRGFNIKGENMYWLAYPEYFLDIIDTNSDSGLTDFAQEIKHFVKKKNIGLVVIDSFTDVMRGNENAAGDVQLFFDGIRMMLKDIAILVIHHANKPSAGVTRTAAQKTRGSTNIMAQVYSAFYVEQIPRHDHEFSFEHIKAGDTEKIKKFKIEMEVHQDLYDKSKTQVMGLKFAGEIEDEEGKEVRAEEIILEILNNKLEISRMELIALCEARGVFSATFNRVIKKLKIDNTVELVPDPSGGNKKLIRLI